MGGILAPFWMPLVSFWLHLGRFWLHFLSKIVFFGTRVRESPADCRLHLSRRKIFACTLTFLGPERVYCRRQLRSAPGRRHLGVLGLVTACALPCTAPHLALHLFSSSPSQQFPAPIFVFLCFFVGNLPVGRLLGHSGLRNRR